MTQRPFYSFWAGHSVITTTLSDRLHELSVIHLWVFDSTGRWIHSPGDGQLVAPQDVHATLTTGGYITLQWTNPGNWISAYDVQRAVADGEFSSLGITLPGTATTITDSSSLRGTSYRYRLLATSASHDSGYSSEASLTAPQPDFIRRKMRQEEARARRTCLPVTEAARNSIGGFLNDPAEAAWRSAHGITATDASILPGLNDASDGAICQRMDLAMVRKPAYYLRANGYIIASDAVPLRADPATGLIRVTHRQHVFVFDSLGWFAYFPGMTGKLAFVPTDLRVISAAAGKVTLAWEIWPSSGVSYQVQRATNSEPFTNVGPRLTTGVATATDTGTVSTSAYRYRILARTAAGDSGYTNEVKVAPSGATDLRVPSAVTRLGAQTACPPAHVIARYFISWFLQEPAEVARRQAYGITATRIEELRPLTEHRDAALCRRMDSTLTLHPASYFSAGSHIIGINAPAPDSVDSIDERAKYLFVFDSAGRFAYTVGARWPVIGPTNFRVMDAASGKVTLAWTNGASNAMRYQLQRATGGAFLPVGPALPGSRAATTDSTARADSSYRYRLVAVGSAGDSTYSNAITVVLRPR